MLIKTAQIAKGFQITAVKSVYFGMSGFQSVWV